MNITVFSTQEFERPFFNEAFASPEHNLNFVSETLTRENLSNLKDVDAVIAFVNDDLGEECLTLLREKGVKFVALRCAGFNNVDVNTAKKLEIPVTHVPHYSPEAVAEFTLALILSLLRNIPQAYRRTKEMNFSLNGLIGENLTGQAVGVVGTGMIGAALVKMLKGFQCQVYAFDVQPNSHLKEMVEYVDLPTLLEKSKVVSLNVPLNADTFHMINADSLKLMPPGSFLVNTGRGGLIDTDALIDAIKSKNLAGVALDVYEQETGVFFKDHSSYGIQDDLLARLTTFPNVIVTSHQAYLSKQALESIAKTTLYNIESFSRGLTGYLIPGL